MDSRGVRQVCAKVFKGERIGAGSEAIADKDDRSSLTPCDERLLIIAAKSDPFDFWDRQPQISANGQMKLQRHLLCDSTSSRIGEQIRALAVRCNDSELILKIRDSVVVVGNDDATLTLENVVDFD